MASGADKNNSIYDQVTSPLVCPACGARGSATWETMRTAAGTGEPQFISMSKDFYERLAAEAPHPIEVICRNCGTRLPKSIRAA